MKKVFAVFLALITLFSISTVYYTGAAEDSEDEVVYTEEIELYFLDPYYEDYITMPGNLPVSYQIKLDKEYTYVRYDAESDLFDAVVVDENGFVTSADGGTSVVTVTTNEDKFFYKFTVKDYASIYANKVMDDYIAENITDDMTEYEKLVKVCEFAARYPYKGNNASYIYAIVTVEGGSCWSSTSMIMCMCDKVGLVNRARDASYEQSEPNDHRNVLVIADGQLYVAEAGYVSGYHYSLSKCDLFKYKTLEDGTLELLEYCGFDNKIEIPETIDGKTVTVIGDSFIYRTEHFIEGGITSVTLPDTITTISANVFFSSAVKEVNIPASVTYIDSTAFNFCEDITINLDENNMHYTTQDGILYDKEMTTLITAYNIPEGHVVIPDGVMYIEKCAFYENDSLTGITFPDSLVNIGYKAFYSCHGLNGASIVFPESLEGIGVYAFWFSNVGSFTFLNPDCIINNTTEDNMCDKEDGNTLSRDSTTLILGYEGSTAQEYAEKFRSYTDSFGDTYNKYIFAPLDTQEDVLLDNGVCNNGTWKAYYNKNEGFKIEVTANGYVGKFYGKTKNDDFRYGHMLDDYTVILANGVKGLSAEACLELGNVSKLVLPKSVDSIAPPNYTYYYYYTVFKNLQTIVTVPGTWAEEYAKSYQLELIYDKSLAVIIQGDADDDGELSVRDCAAIAGALAKGTTAKLPDYADYDEDGNITVRDAAALARVLAKKK